MNKIILITQPDHDFTTMFLSAWCNEVKVVADEKKDTTICLKSDRANKKELESIILRKKPHFILFNGHGDYDYVTGQNSEILIKADDNEHLLSGTVVYTIACRSAKVLGIKAIQKGTKAFIGYKEDFWFVYSRKNIKTPLLDNVAKIFFRCSNQFGKSLVKGSTVGEAFEMTKKAYKRAILEQVLSSSPESNSYLPLLIWDYTHLTLEGNSSTSL